MDQGDDVDEMWIFPLLDRENSHHYHFSSDQHHSVEDVVQQYFQHQERPQHHPNQEDKQQRGERSGCGRCLRERKRVGVDTINLFKGREKGSRRKIKPSPYHNYQKHLITAIRHILVPPQVTSMSSNITQIEALLWKAFLSNHSQTKKILYFIFNEQNEYSVSAHELREFGFEQIYERYSTEQISLAKSLMSELALQQLSSENMDHYLSTRRIKDPSKFKRYVEMFLAELQEGYIKKRLSSKHRVMRRPSLVDLQSL